MALKDSIKQIGRFIGILPQQSPDYDPYGYQGDPYAGGGYDAGYDDGYGDGGYQQPAPIPFHQQQQYAPPRGAGGQRQYPQEEAYYQPRPQPAGPARPVQTQEEVPPSVSLFGNNQRSKRPPDNVVQMPRGEDVGATRSKHSEIIVCVRTMEDCQEIINALLEGKSVFIKMEPLEDPRAQRIIDMLGGASFALRGTMAKISHRVYLLAPNNVDVVNNQGTTQGFRSEFAAANRG